MRYGWHEVDRFPAPGGSTARSARDHFVLETLETVKEAVWMEEALGTFTIFGRTFRVELAGPNSDQWKVEELKAKGSRYA